MKYLDADLLPSVYQFERVLHRESVRRVARRYATEFPSESARKQYLKEHPKADPHKHTVAPESREKPTSEEGDKPEEGKKQEKPKGKPKTFLKGLAEKTKSYLSEASEAVQKFVSDGEHRSKLLSEAGKSVLKSPKTYAKRLVETAKHEVHEFKEAGEALAHLAKGKKLDPAQKKVLKTVAIHMGIAVAAAALTSTGVFAGAAVFSKGLAQKIALKAALRALENVHLLQEIHHIGHGAMHLLASEEEEASPEEAFAALVMQSVSKELDDLSGDDLSKYLDELADDA